MKSMRLNLQEKYTQVFLTWKPSMLGEGEYHGYKPIEYFTIFLKNSYNGGIVLQWRKR